MPSLRKRLEDLERVLSPSAGAHALGLLCEAIAGTPGSRERLQEAMDAGIRWDGRMNEIAAVFLAGPAEGPQVIQ
jgi:hypothetical protein